MIEPTGTIKIWQGKSLFTGRVTSMYLGPWKHNNPKLGPDIIQTWILEDEQPPHIAVKTGHDQSACGMCGMRPLLWERAVQRAKATNAILEKDVGACYLRTFQAPRAVHAASVNKPVTPFDHWAPLVATKTGRHTAYGDGLAVPVTVWHKVQEAFASNLAYTHSFYLRRAQAYKRLFVASTNPATYADAKALGWTTFTVIRADQTWTKKAQWPASTESPHHDTTTCSSCGLCHPSVAREHDPWTIAHGTFAKP